MSALAGEPKPLNGVKRPLIFVSRSGTAKALTNGYQKTKFSSTLLLEIYVAAIDKEINLGTLGGRCARLYAKYAEWGDVDTIPYEFAKFYNDMSFERAYEKDKVRAVEYTRRAWVLMDKGDLKA